MRHHRRSLTQVHSQRICMWFCTQCCEDWSTKIWRSTRAEVWLYCAGSLSGSTQCGRAWSGFRLGTSQIEESPRWKLWIGFDFLLATICQPVGTCCDSNYACGGWWYSFGRSRSKRNWLTKEMRITIITYKSSRESHHRIQLLLFQHIWSSLV